MLKKANRKKREKGPSIDWAVIRRTALASGTLIVLTASVIVLFLLLDRPVTEITVDGPFARVNATQVEAVVVENIHGGFISTDLEGLAASIRRLPWVDQVTIRRQWPDGLHVILFEQQPAAQWGESGLLNVRGELFIEDTRHIPAGLPTLAGPAGSEKRVAALYLSIRERLLDRNLDISYFGRDQRGAWKLVLTNGIKVRLGRRDLDRRLDRFAGLVLDVVTTQLNDIDYVDMRYSNGFAIGWQQPKKAAANAASSTARSG